ncbi:ecdysone oxidase-like [Cydia fagiglandana]|uniref:ecdysone oxidase-like n=1 Tax=Cydia fagiglandana TaxID=1458189 RepID=UPI002FEE4937
MPMMLAAFPRWITTDSLCTRNDSERGPSPFHGGMVLLNYVVSASEVALLPRLVKLIQVALAGLAVLHLGADNYPSQATVLDGDQFDLIVVGAGSAGAVIAARLSEIAGRFDFIAARLSKIVGWKILMLIEAGDNPPVDSVIPGLFPFVDYSMADWNYYSEDDGYSCQAHKTKTVHITRGKMLGGSSGANYMYYVRGNKGDYENWVSQGGIGWDWDNVTHYFKKSEGLKSPEILAAGSADLHNTEGPLGVSLLKWDEETMNTLNSYLSAFGEKHPILIDTNGHEQIGYALPPFTVYDKRRQSTAVSFLRPIKSRENLYVLKNTLCTKVLFDENLRAIGVEVKLPSKKMININANKEVVLSAGSINTPQLLMLSGIGPQPHLIDMGIEVVLDSPLVGQNLQDHCYYLVILTGRKGFESVPQNIKVLTNLDQFPIPAITGHIALSNDSTVPDYQAQVYAVPAATVFSTLVCSYVFGLDDKICTAIAKASQKQETLVAALSMLHPDSRGHIELRSKNPEDKPKIFLGYYENDADLDKHAKIAKHYLEVLDSEYMRSVNSEVVDIKVPQCADIEFNTHEYWKCVALNTASTQWYPSGTCVMGVEGKSVVDPELRVRGVTGLRIGDASIIPSLTSGNLNAPVIMIGEKLADMIKQTRGK